MAEKVEVMSARETVRSLPSSFWVANIMEIVERYDFSAAQITYITDVFQGGGIFDVMQCICFYGLSHWRRELIIGIGNV